MPFDPTKPANGDVVDADVIRNQLNALNDKISVPKLPDFTTIASPTEGMLAFDYTTHTLRFYTGQEWAQIWP